VPALCRVDVEQIGVLRPDFGQRRVEFAFDDAGARERSAPQRHDQVAQTGGHHFQRQAAVEVGGVHREPRRHLCA